MILLPAPLTVATAATHEAGVCEQVKKALASAPAGVAEAKAGQKIVEIDCSSLQQGFDSAALAVLLAAVRCAATNGGGLVLLNVPENLRKLASLYGVDTLLFARSTSA